MKRREFLSKTRDVMLMLGVGGGVLTCSGLVQAGTLDAHESNTLIQFVKHLFPHTNFPDNTFKLIINKLDSEQVKSDLVQTLKDGVKALDIAQDGSWLSLPASEQLMVMTSQESTPLFQLLHHKGMVSIYNDKSVWEIIGYQGSSVEKGGYLYRGFDDIDWLPEGTLL